jgi:Predicted metal-dependent hydrolase of the TIM-barrel fold
MRKENKYRIIDTHAHIFPDKIAEKAVDSIGRYYGISMAGEGTVQGLIERGERIGVGKYLIHSSATQVEQVKAINDYVSSVQATDDRFIGFGTLHPDFEDAESETERIITLGLKGIKLHPEFQGFSIDDKSMMHIYRAIEGKLPVLIHVGDENRTSSSPARLSRIMEMFPRLVVIAAHFGGYQMWDESIKYLIGKNLYMDTSSALFKLEPQKAVSMIRKHGYTRMLFGSDYPMWDHEEELERFMKLDLTEEERKAILSENAERLLKIKAV